MIIDTNNIKDYMLVAYAHLILKNLRPFTDGKWHAYPFIEDHELEFNKIFIDGKCIVEFGDCGKAFSFDSTYSNVKSLKGLPTKVDTFDIDNLFIDVVDYLPISDSYEMSNCKIKRIDYPFPKNIKSLTIDDNFLTNFDNFPKSVDVLEISSNKFKNLKGSPLVEDYANIGHMKELVDISDLKGDYKELYLTELGINSLPDFPETLKTLNIRDCENLTDISSLLSLKENTTIFISNSYNIDLYTLNQVKCLIDIRCEYFNFYKELFNELGPEKSIEMGKLGFETALYDKLLNTNTYVWVKIQFQSKELNIKRNNILKSNKSINKFNL